MNIVHVHGSSFEPYWPEYMKRCRNNIRSREEEISDTRHFGIVEICRDIGGTNLETMNREIAGVSVFDLEFIITQKLNKTYVELLWGDILLRRAIVFPYRETYNNIQTFFEEDRFVELHPNRVITLQTSAAYYLTQPLAESLIPFLRYS